MHLFILLEGRIGHYLEKPTIIRKHAPQNLWCRAFIWLVAYGFSIPPDHHCTVREGERGACFFVCPIPSCLLPSFLPHPDSCHLPLFDGPSEHGRESGNRGAAAAETNIKAVRNGRQFGPWKREVGGGPEEARRGMEEEEMEDCGVTSSLPRWRFGSEEGGRGRLILC